MDHGDDTAMGRRRATSGLASIAVVFAAAAALAQVPPPAPVPPPVAARDPDTRAADSDPRARAEAAQDLAMDPDPRAGKMPATLLGSDTPELRKVENRMQFVIMTRL